MWFGAQFFGAGVQEDGLAKIFEVRLAMHYTTEMRYMIPFNSYRN
jgi:hypothetical protein